LSRGTNSEQKRLLVTLRSKQVVAALLLTATFGPGVKGAARPASIESRFPNNEHVILLGHGLSDTQAIVFTAAVAAARHSGVVLLNTPSVEHHLQRFLDSLHAEQVIVVSAPSRLGASAKPVHGKSIVPVPWGESEPTALWQSLALSTERIVVCSASIRPVLLQSACLAGVLGVPLYVLDKDSGAAAMRSRLATWHTKEVLAAGDAIELCTQLTGVRVVKFADARAVAERSVKELDKHGPISTLVVANPADTAAQGDQGISTLAAWLAAEKQAALLLTNEAGDNVEDLVSAAVRDRRLHGVDSVILVGSPKSIPQRHRPNPAPGKDLSIEMEPLTPAGADPFSFATGRLFHRNAGLVTLMLARQRLLERTETRRRALVVGNPAGGLPLLEAFSRNTAFELRNAGYETTALFSKEVSKDTVRRLLPEQDIFLWEGHHSTLAKDYDLPNWPEPLKPSLVFLQSCLALCEADAEPLLERGAIGVIGTPNRTYSASGGACSLAFFDALLYQNQSLGASLRQAKNFLLAYTMLKEKRLGEDAKLRGANLRSAWAFTLWGDPTLHLPRPQVKGNALLSVSHEVSGNTIIVRQPSAHYQNVSSQNYRASMLPNARLAGLLFKDESSDERRFVPLLFTEVSLPKAPADKIPSLHSRLPSDHWVFCWDSRRRTGYLLITPRAKDLDELRFHVTWRGKDEG
jgi:hypothetical protein